MLYHLPEGHRHVVRLLVHQTELLQSLLLQEIEPLEQKAKPSNSQQEQSKTKM